MKRCSIFPFPVLLKFRGIDIIRYIVRLNNERKLFSRTKQTLNEFIKNKSEELLSNELTLRKKNKLPPFLRLIAIIISAKSRSISLQGAREIKTKLSNIKDLEVSLTIVLRAVRQINLGSLLKYIHVSYTACIEFCEGWFL